MAIEPARRYELISARAFEHPADRAATSALHAVPLLDRVVKRLVEMGHERRFRQLTLGNAVRIGPDQVPDAWGRHVAAATALDLGSVPPLYVTNSADVNAMTVGSNQPIVVVNSSLVSSYTADEVQTVLAHEAGHVLAEHYHYETALRLLHNMLRMALFRSVVLAAPLRGLYYALLEWHRAAELSSDRAAALVMGDPLAVCRLMMRVAGGALPGMSLDAFVAQADDYEGEDDVFSRYSRFWTEISMSHPFPVRRVKELIGWVRAGEFDRIRSGTYARRGQEPPPSAEFRAAVSHYGERFARFADRASGDVQHLGRQVGDWVRRHAPPGASRSGPDDDDLFGGEPA